MEAENIYTINSVHPWRMLLFGVMGCLLPIVLFIMSWNWWDPEFTNQFDYFFDWLIIPTLLLSAAMTYSGFKLSAVLLKITMQEDGIMVEKKTRFPLIPRETLFKTWSDIKSYRYTEDNKGKVLTIGLNNDSDITIAQAYVLDRSGHFDAFYQIFAEYFKKYREE